MFKIICTWFNFARKLHSKNQFNQWDSEHFDQWDSERILKYWNKLKYWIYKNHLKKARSNLINNFSPNECEKIQISLVEMSNMTIAVNWAFIDNMRERICSVNKKVRWREKKNHVQQTVASRNRKFHFSFHSISLGSFCFQWSSLGFVSQVCERALALSVCKYNMYIYWLSAHGHIPFVCYWPFNRFVERNSKLSNEHIYDTNLHLCFVSSPIRIVANMKCGFWNKFYISIKFQNEKGVESDRDKTMKYARISISYNNNYDRHKYFIRQ